MAEIPEITPKERPWLRIALAVSLALNLAVVGVVAGAILSGGRHERHGDMVRDLGFGPFTEALSPTDRDTLRRSFFERAPEFRQSRGEMRADFAAVLAALRASPFDVQVLTDALNRQSARAAKNLTLGQSLIADHIIAMSDADRSAFADRLEASATRRSQKPRP